MPLIETNYPPPDEMLLNDSGYTFLIFYSSEVDGQLWCPHCRDIEGIVKAAFTGHSKPKGVITYVGKRNEWKDVPSHPARHKWGVKSVPTLIRLKDGKESARASKADVLDAERFEEFLQPRS